MNTDFGIKGFLETSFLDWPGRLAAVLFLGGCNFRCPFCHNAELVLAPHAIPSIPLTTVLERLRPLRGWVDTEWAETISKLLVSGQYQKLARQATEDRINAAGNNSGELLNWITVAGAVGKTKPLFLEGDEGNGYAVWKFD